MRDCRNFYIDGKWVAPSAPNDFPVIDPSNEEPFATITLGAQADVDAAVAAARRAFPTFSQTSKQERLDLLDAILGAYQKRIADVAEAITAEMGAPTWLAHAAQAPCGLAHLAETRRILDAYEFEETRGKTLICKEPVGVVAMITPWNWPINQIACKVAPALAAGCTMVLKPSEIAPVSAHLWAEILHEAGVPPGVFNLVDGDGPTVGAALASHPDVDMVSFTGSVRAGVAVAQAAAPTVKRVTQELGGKSANIVLDDADLQAAVVGGVRGCFMNSGQSCNAPTRMLVPRDRHAEAVEIARAAASQTVVGDPRGEGMPLGPVVSQTQFERIQALIQEGIDEGATLVAGGVGRPDGLERGYYVKPTVFADVTNDMTVAREEIFGPVLSILPYDDEEDAIRIANDTPYGLSGYVTSADPDRARRVARRLRTGMVHINGAQVDFAGAFGGYKQSGNGREWGVDGFEEMLEIKTLFGGV